MSELQAQCWICPHCFDDKHHDEEKCRYAVKLCRVIRGEWRMVGVQRKRKLRRRGTPVWWDRDLLSFVWEPRATTGDAQ